MTDEHLVSLVGVFLAALLFVLLLARVFRPKAQKEHIPENAILVDGSNVMHWGGDPSASVLNRVVAALEDEDRVPYLCFDANVGYKLFDRYMSSRELGRYLRLPSEQIFVVNKGVVADEVLLDLASEHGLQIVTNDRFRDWSDRYPWVADQKRFRRGRWAKEQVVWSRERR